MSPPSSACCAASASSACSIAAPIAARLLEPRSKLAAARGFHAQTASSSLGDLLGLGDADAGEQYDPRPLDHAGRQRAPTAALLEDFCKRAARTVWTEVRG